MDRAGLFKAVKEAIYRYIPYDCWLPAVAERDLRSFKLEFERCEFDHEVVLADGSTALVIFGPPREKGQIFAVWHFNSDGQFVDYVERSHPPTGVGDYEWLEQVCAEVEK